MCDFKKDNSTVSGKSEFDYVAKGCDESIVLDSFFSSRDLMARSYLEKLGESANPRSIIVKSIWI